MSNTESKHVGSTHLVPGMTLGAFCDSDSWTLPTPVIFLTIKIPMY